jgi:ATP-dependent DNA helicase RecQ
MVEVYLNSDLLALVITFLQIKGLFVGCILAPMFDLSELAANLRALYHIDRTFCVLVAPVASGKTKLCESLIGDLDMPWKRVLFVSPLRALGEEVWKKWSAACKQYPQWHLVDLLNGNKSKNILEFQQSSKFCVGVCMAETISKFSDFDEKTLIIWDEWHLCFHWEHFRPHLLEQFMALCASGVSILALSATINEELTGPTVKGLETNYEQCFQLDLGNYQFRFAPSQTMYFPLPLFPSNFFRKLLQRHLILHAKKKGNQLIFVKRRHEVDQWLEWCARQKIQAIGCVGGAVPQFLAALDGYDQQRPLVIIATSVLGHGVNLPSIQSIYLLDASLEKELWVQMVGRGGRDGRPYELWTQSLPLSSFRMKLKQFFMTLWRIFY